MADVTPKLCKSQKLDAATLDRWARVERLDKSDCFEWIDWLLVFKGPRDTARGTHENSISACVLRSER